MTDSQLRCFNVGEVVSDISVQARNLGNGNGIDICGEGRYRKPLLSLVSRALQDRDKVVPLMGMEIYQAQVKAALAATLVTATVTQFNTRDNPGETASSAHGKFDNDPATMNSMLTTVLGVTPDRRFEKEDLN